MDHVVEYEQELSYTALTAVAVALREALEENDDSLTVGSTTFKAAEAPEMLFGEDEETGNTFLQCKTMWWRLGRYYTIYHIS